MHENPRRSGLRGDTTVRDTCTCGSVLPCHMPPVLALGWCWSQPATHTRSLGTFRKGPRHTWPPCAFPVGNWIRLRTQRWKVNHPPGFLGHPGRVSVWKRSSTLWREILTGDEKTLPAHSPCCASICSHSWEGVIYIQSPAFCLGDAGLLKLTVGASEMCDLSWPPTWGLCPLAARQPPGEDNPEAI